MAVHGKIGRDVPQALAAAAHGLRPGDGRLLRLDCDQLAIIVGAESKRRWGAAAQSQAVRCLVCCHRFRGRIGATLAGSTIPSVGKLARMVSAT
jgi:hypothetical protein